jgi:putative addiction module antidote
MEKAMVRKIFRTGNSLVVSLPKETITMLGLQEGSEVSVVVDASNRQIVIEPIKADLEGIDETFARQLAEFIERYRPALEALAK